MFFMKISSSTISRVSLSRLALEEATLLNQHLVNTDKSMFTKAKQKIFLTHQQTRKFSPNITSNTCAKVRAREKLSYQISLREKWKENTSECENSVSVAGELSTRWSFCVDCSQIAFNEKKNHSSDR